MKTALFHWTEIKVMGGRFFGKNFNQHGAALMLVLIILTLMGLAAGIAGSSWQTITQRAKEEDLLWKGGQIRTAIGRYYQTPQTGGTTIRKFPAGLEDLLLDSRYLETVRYLRKLYPDPMTGSQWEIVAAPGGGVMGVKSTSTQKPFKQDNFPEENRNFSGKQSYREWEFIYQPTVPKTTKPATGTGSSGVNTSRSP